MQHAADEKRSRPQYATWTCRQVHCEAAAIYYTPNRFPSPSLGGLRETQLAEEHCETIGGWARRARSASVLNETMNVDKVSPTECQMNPYDFWRLTINPRLRMALPQ